jgi:hypothetical protein
VSAAVADHAGHDRHELELVPEPPAAAGTSLDIHHEAGSVMFGTMTIVGAHMLLYTPQADALREVLRDVFEWDHVEDGPGWLIFKLPPAELGVHPSGGETHHQLHLMCDDLDATVADLRTKGITFEGSPTTDSWGTWITMLLPGNVRVTLYRHAHETPLDLR